MTNLPIVLYHYDASPFASKAKSMLLVKGIPHKRVSVSMRMPRPEITDLLGLGYRRIPLLAIGNDVYCDTGLIASVLERRFPVTAGHPPLFPPRVGGGRTDGALAKLLMRYWADSALFRLAVDSLPYAKFDQEFIQDRKEFFGEDPETLSENQGVRTSAIASHLALVEEQLADGRQWLMDTESVGLVDLAAHTFFTWMRRFKSLHGLFNEDSIPCTLAWITRTTELLKVAEGTNAAAFEEMAAEDAAKLIASSPHEDESTVGFEIEEGTRLSVNVGDMVSITPVDTGPIPTVGRLLALSRAESVVEVTGSVGNIRFHFPRLEFVLRPVNVTQASNRL
ncbi:glutathione S-transferase family protein [Phanerochaete sordida]|uniref:Glutathione S-transferase family protein n=1 Tax=Phanerochaete sordida TaxID=48140 RepID=A0A9P3FZ52_9APHY|nr:glutathione S-transferase family protein [Phanerochaete sordida]